MQAAIPVILATGNAGKVREFDRLFTGVFEVLPLPLGVALPEETGATFAENAKLKAQKVFEGLGGRQAVLADDSGLQVTALGGRPGIYSARYAGDNATDAENVAKLLGELDGAADRGARFACALCLALPACADASAGTFIEVEGFTSGSITLEPRGLDGFGYDPVFQPEGWGQTLAEASPGDKDAVSHRGAAARALLDRLARTIGA
jgi:XTP/dITP diphosphohydrolase